MSYNELVAEVSAQWQQRSLESSFEEGVAIYISDKKQLSQEYYDDVIQKKENVTAEDYIAFHEHMLGPFNELTGEYGDSEIASRLDYEASVYFEAIDDYVADRLLELYSEELDAATDGVEAEALQTIGDELALIDRSDTGTYAEDLAADLETAEQDYRQQGESERNAAASNSELKKSLENKQEAYPADARDAAEPTIDKARTDVELELEKRAKEEIREFIDDLLDDLPPEVAEEHSEVECEYSHAKVEAWNRDVRSFLENYPVDLIVDTASDASQDNPDRKSRLEVLVDNTLQGLRNYMDLMLDDLEAISDLEDPASCSEGGGNKPSFEKPEQITSPLLLDLDGEGIETLSHSEFIYFDHDNNGFSELTGWVAPDDGLLVMDLDGDGRISNGEELFGNNTRLQDGRYAANGFEALAALDQNFDSVVDAQDEGYGRLRIWQDLDADARVDDGELLTLEEVGVSALSVQWQPASEVDDNGNTIRQRGNATLADGSTAQLADVWFGVDRTLTITRDRLEPGDGIRALPNARGFGNVHDLDQAMARDPLLQAMVQAFVDESDDSARRAMLDGLIYQWTGVADVDPYSRDPSRVYGHVMDARQLEALEALVGRGYLGTWCWGQRDPNPHGRAAPVLIAQYETFKAFVYGQLMAQSHYADAFELIGVRYDPQSLAFVPDTAAFSGYLEQLLEAGDVVEVSRIYGVLRDLGLYSIAMEQVATELRANPVLAPILADNLVAGGDGDDTLSGTGGDDLMVGGKGDDSLFGKVGNDTYLFEPGDGADRIYDSAGVDTLSFGAGVSAQSLKITRGVSSLLVTLLDANGVPTGDSVRIDNVFDFDGSLREGAIEAFRFQDGASLSLSQIVERIEQPVTEGDDTLFGTEGADRFEALQGHDTLYGGAGDDVYRFAPGHGQDLIYENAGVDTIEFYGGILPTDVKIERAGPDGEDLVLHLFDPDGRPTGDRITVAKAYQDHRVSTNRIEQVRFVLADGSTEVRALDALDKLYATTELDDVIYGFESGEEIHSLAGIDEVHGAGGDDQLYGDADDDRLFGEDGNDNLSGGAGNDRLQGGTGDDLYRFAAGDGHDLIVNSDRLGRDALVFDASVSRKKVRLLRVGDDLLISIDRNADSVQIAGYFSGDGVSDSALGEIRFADGSLLSIEDVMAMTLQATQGADYLEGYGSDDSIAARGGDDIVYGRSGNDLISGDQGNDLIFGENGSDMLFGGQGADQLYGGQGADVLDGGAESDRLFGSSGEDLLHGGEGDDLLSGGAQDDRLEGENGDDRLHGDQGNDSLSGGNGDDDLEGGAGDDILEGGNGNDRYRYAPGDGDDLILTAARDGRGQDVLSLSGFAPDELWLSRQGDDLLVGFVGTEGSISVSGWGTEPSVIDGLQLDGFVACEDDLARLVSAMAAFDAPTGAGEIVPQDVREQLQPVLAASWQPVA
ncbi:calcium-binding protein [Marinobacterium aestuariivivens]|uniref:Calcium-binding protein n=1 Tax=Marinobacterium aestuariivivens TaxID=1698799 RepID=A0ABW1ZWV1_9GAMM